MDNIIVCPIYWVQYPIQYIGLVIGLGLLSQKNIGLVIGLGGYFHKTFWVAYWFGISCHIKFWFGYWVVFIFL